MKKSYFEPHIELERFEAEDVITTSSNTTPWIPVSGDGTANRAINDDPIV